MNSADFLKIVESAKKEIKDTLYNLLWEMCVEAINSEDAVSHMLNSEYITLNYIPNAVKRAEEERRVKAELKEKYALNEETLKKYEDEANECVNLQLAQYGWKLEIEFGSMWHIIPERTE